MWITRFDKQICRLSSLFLLVAISIETIRYIPKRLLYFEKYASQGYSQKLLMVFAFAMPLCLIAIFLVLSPMAWRYRPGRWLPAPNFRGIGFLSTALLALFLVDNFGFSKLIQPSFTPHFTFFWHFRYFSYNMALALSAGGIGAIIKGLMTKTSEADTKADVEAERAKEANRALQEATNRLVVAQLDPHNTLNILANAAVMVHEDPVKTEAMLEASGHYLRRVMNATKLKSIPLWQEREIINEYLTVQGIRFGEHLVVEWDWQNALEETQIPPILILPMVENAIKHGVWPNPEGGTIRLSFRQEGPMLRLEVRNTGTPLTKDHRAESTGLQNILDRLSHAYGSAATFTLTSEAEWTVAAITLPLEAACVS